MAQLAPQSDSLDDYDISDGNAPPVSADDVAVQFRFPPPIVPTPISPSVLPESPRRHPDGNHGNGSTVRSAARAHGQADFTVDERRQFPVVGSALHHFGGRNVLCFRGRVVLGPPNSCRTVSATIMLISIPSVAFLAVPGVSLWNLGYGMVLVFGAIIIAWTLFFLWLAAATDPGILPRWPRPRPG